MFSLKRIAYSLLAKTFKYKVQDLHVNIKTWQLTSHNLGPKSRPRTQHDSLNQGPNNYSIHIIKGFHKNRVLIKLQFPINYCE